MNSTSAVAGTGANPSPDETFWPVPAKRRDRHLQEGDEQHQGQHRIDRPLKTLDVRDQDPDSRRKEHSGEVDPDLPGLEGVAKFGGVHRKSWARGAPLPSPTSPTCQAFSLQPQAPGTQQAA